VGRHVRDGSSGKLGLDLTGGSTGSPPTDDPNCTIPLPSAGTSSPKAASGKALDGGLSSTASADPRYRIVGPLGEGGMGVVYRAEDTRLGRTVALKTIPASLTANRRAKERFLKEARAASALDHPNLCTVYEIDETPEGQLCLLMPCYEGETLRSRLQRGPLPVREAIYIAQQVARGLAKAHGQGIVHCDIKPANLMLTADGVVKILDFGIARLSGEAQPIAAGPYGTPKYRSPEQARGGEVDASSDIWSLGIVLYEMLTGRLPGGDQHGPALAWKESTELINLLQEEAPELEDIISRMLAWRPTHRYPDAAALLIDLDRLEGQPWARGPEAGTAPFKDRQLALVGFGFLEICIAVGCLVPSGLIVFAYFSLPKARETIVVKDLWFHLAAPLLVCAAAMVFFTCMGVGSILARRWAGALMLITSWIWLYSGVLGSAFAVSLALAVQPEALTLFCFWFILMPALFVIFYSSRNVKATLAARDPKLRWTDRCPAPVFAVAFLLMLGAACSLVIAPLGRVSAFGKILTGGPAVTFYLALAGVFISIAVALYELRPWAWWVLLGLCMVGFIAGLLAPAAAPQVSTPELWGRPPAPPPPPPGSVTPVVFSFNSGSLFWVLWSRSFIGYLVYLFWIKKYFASRSGALGARGPAPPQPLAVRR
jgi:hypothetical protein